jgi:hypothetical protein
LCPGAVSRVFGVDHRCQETCGALRDGRTG